MTELRGALHQIADGAARAAVPSDASTVGQLLTETRRRRRRALGVTVGLAATGVAAVVAAGIAVAGVPGPDRAREPAATPSPSASAAVPVDVDYALCGTSVDDLGWRSAPGSVAPAISNGPTMTTDGAVELWATVTMSPDTVATAETVALVVLDPVGLSVVGVTADNPGAGGTGRLDLDALGGGLAVVSEPLFSCAAQDGLTRLPDGGYVLKVSRTVWHRATAADAELPVLAVADLDLWVGLPKPARLDVDARINATSEPQIVPVADIVGLPERVGVSDVVSLTVRLTNASDGVERGVLAPGTSRFLVTEDGRLAAYQPWLFTPLEIDLGPGESVEVPMPLALSSSVAGGSGSYGLQTTGEMEAWLSLAWTGADGVTAETVAGPWPLGVDVPAPDLSSLPVAVPSFLDTVWSVGQSGPTWSVAGEIAGDDGYARVVEALTAAGFDLLGGSAAPGTHQQGLVSFSGSGYLVLVAVSPPSGGSSQVEFDVWPS